MDYKYFLFMINMTKNYLMLSSESGYTLINAEDDAYIFVNESLNEKLNYEIKKSESIFINNIDEGEICG